MAPFSEGRFEDEFCPEEPQPAPHDSHVNDDVKHTVVPAKVVIVDQYRSDSRMTRSSISRVSVSKAQVQRASVTTGLRINAMLTTNSEVSGASPARVAKKALETSRQEEIDLSFNEHRKYDDGLDEGEMDIIRRNLAKRRDADESKLLHKSQRMRTSKASGHAPADKLLALNRSVDGHIYEQGIYVKPIKINMERLPEMANAAQKLEFTSIGDSDVLGTSETPEHGDSKAQQKQD